MDIPTIITMTHCDLNLRLGSILMLICLQLLVRDVIQDYASLCRPYAATSQPAFIHITIVASERVKKPAYECAHLSERLNE